MLEMKRFVLHAALVLAAAAAVAQAPPSLSTRQLLTTFESARGAEQAQAAQLLAFRGLEALPAVLDLMNHDSVEVAKPAYDVAFLIVNDLSAPGRAEDRAEAAELVTPYLASNQPHQTRTRALELLAIAAPADYVPAPVAGLLAEDDLREEARRALEWINSEASRTALAEAAAAEEDPAFRAALLDALAACEAPEGITVAQRMLRDGSPAVRAAAARAVAWQGDPAHGDLLADAYMEADRETRFAVAEAWVEWAESMAKAGGNWDTAMDAFRMALENAQDPAIRAAAIMGLARYGDETVVDTIVDAAMAQGEPFNRIIGPAFRALEGKAPEPAMVEAYRGMPESLQALVMPALAARGGDTMAELIAEQATDAEGEVRLTALDALGVTASPAAVPALAAAAAGEGQSAEVALDSLTRVADALAAQGNASAGAAWAAVLRHADSASLRRRALGGLATHPDTGAYEAVASALVQADTQQAAVPAMMALASTFIAEGKSEQAVKAYEALQEANPSVDAVVQMAGQLEQIGKSIDTARLLGFVNRWYIAGPFDWENAGDWEERFVGEPGVDPEADDVNWKVVTTTGGSVNLISHVGAESSVFGYGYVEFEVPQGGPAQIRLGSDDGNQVWLNGEQVAEHRVDRGAAPDQDIIPVTLRDGRNTLLLKISQGGGGWNFICRLTDSHGAGYPFTIIAPAE
jgi:HEAT repeat protein